MLIQMKKLFLLPIGILALALCSFSTKKEKVFELMPDGNYSIIDGSRLTQDDIDLLLSNTQILKGAAEFNETKTFNESVIKNFVRALLKFKTKKDCDCPTDPLPDDTIVALIEKYNN